MIATYVELAICALPSRAQVRGTFMVLSARLGEAPLTVAQSW